MEQKVHNLLGLMARARKIDVGTSKIYDGIKKSKYDLIVIAGDAQEKTRRKIERLTETHQTKLITIGTKDDLANAIGKQFTVAIAIKDKGFSQSLLKIVE